MGDRLQGRTAVITGASSGIGAATARLFAAEGAKVVINYRSSRERAQSVADSIREAGGCAFAVQGDVSDPGQVRELVARALSHLGHFDIWCNFAGADILTGEGAGLSALEKLDRLISVDLRGTILCSWEVAELMHARGSGAIVNMSWDLVLHGMEGVNPQMFAAVKGGVMSFSKCLSRHYAPQVRVNDVAPGWIETAFAREEMRQEYYRDVIEKTPLKRFGQPEEVARAALFLASDEAAFITGQTLRVNGGLV